jgi:TRAP-type uncharacterized transport system fused permease subunit
MSAPACIQSFVRLSYIHLGLSIGVGFLSWPMIKHQARITGNVLFWVFLLLAFLTWIYIWLLDRVKTGRNWARLLCFALFFFGLSDDLILSAKNFTQFPVTVVLRLGLDIFYFCILLLAFRPEANVWFGRRAGCLD